MRNKTVLFVSNNENECNLFREFLSENNRACPLIVANTCIDALFVLMEMGTPPDILITEFNMPDMTGFELAEAIRNNQDYDTIHIFVIGSGEEIGKDYTQYGVESCFVKPTTTESLSAIVSYIVNQYS